MGTYNTVVLAGAKEFYCKITHFGCVDAVTTGGRATTLNMTQNCNARIQINSITNLLCDIICIANTFVGGLATKSLLSAVLGTGFGNLGFALAFAVSAAATIIANVSRTDIDALSKESILADVTAALEGSAAGATLGYMIGGTLGDAIAGGAVGLITTFGVAIGIKADAQVAAEGITKNNIIAKLLSLTALGIGGASTGAKLASAGLKAAGATGMAMLFDGVAIATFGVAIGINATNQVVDGSGINPTVVGDLPEVLAAMNRSYTREKYLSLIDYAYELMPDLSIANNSAIAF